MKKSLALVSSILVLGGGLMRCSSDNTATDAGGDVTTPDVSKPDVGQPDNFVPVVTPAGTLLTASDKIQVFGVTADDQVIYADNGSANGALFAVDASGGTPTQIAKPTVSSSASYIAGISGKVVFVWEGVSTSSNAAEVGTLHLWMKGGSYVLAVPSDAGTGKSCASAGFASSTDGTKVMFAANSNNNCTQGDIVGANSDGTSLATLATGVDLASDCSPFFGFAGGVHPVSATCATAPGDGGTPSADVSSYDPASAWAATAVTTGAYAFWASDTAGDKLLVAKTTGTQVFPIGGGTATDIDTKNIGATGFGYMTKDGNDVLYTTPAGDIWRSPVTSPAPVALQSSGVKVVRSYSADEKYFIFNTTFDAQQFGSDLFLASMTAAGTPVTLESGTTGALFGLRFSDDFTTDSKYAVYIKNLDANQGIGDLYAVPVAGGNPVQVTTAEWQNISATGSKIVFNDNCQNCSGTSASSGGTADIKSIDLSTSTTATTLQAGADVSIFVNNARTRVIYTFSTNPDAADGGVQGNGLYSVAIP